MALSEDTIACRWGLNKACWIAFCLVGLFLSACTGSPEEETDTLPFYNSAEFDADWISEDDPRFGNIHTIDTFSLTNQEGQTVGSESLAGHVYVANFFFTSCPSICPKMTTNMHLLQDAFADADELLLVSFSVTPWIDSVSRLQNYAEINRIDPTKWHLLTGDKERIYELARRSYFAEKGLGLQKGSDEFLHTESMLLVDKKGRIRGIYNATQKVEIERVSEDIRTLLKE